MFRMLRPRRVEVSPILLSVMRVIPSGRVRVFWDVVFWPMSRQQWKPSRRRCAVAQRRLRPKYELIFSDLTGRALDMHRERHWWRQPALSFVVLYAVPIWVRGDEGLSNQERGNS